MPTATFKKWNPVPSCRCQDAWSSPSRMRPLLAAMRCDLMGSKERRLREPRGPAPSVETLCNLAETFLPASLSRYLLSNSLHSITFNSLICLTQWSPFSVPLPTAGITSAGKSSSCSQISSLSISYLPKAEGKKAGPVPWQSLPGSRGYTQKTSRHIIKPDNFGVY